MIKIDKACFLFYLVIFTSHSLFAQPKKNEKYPSLLWEITGKGMSKPSYLFGTMHVSNKMVFHLGDSFYNAIRNTETVALELNPDLWQGQMVQLEKQKERYTAFTGESGNNYITESSFRLYHYLDEIKLALQTEPAIVNNLLYRSYKSKEDFEEDTFLDLYIFQTGRKLGKKAAGVENFYESEKLVMEAYTDMAREKKKKTVDLGEESTSEIMEKMQQAYRRGDLDLMDSLDVLMERSTAFREKFLYKRNELQASAMDSIMQKNALFVGVGAAHLPGKRGVIELLRALGYHLRPVKMANHNTEQKSIIDNLDVPVVFEKKYAEDQFYSVDVPGDLNRIRQDYMNLDRRQFADMGNGSYYMVTRVKTHAAILNETEQDVFKKVDSILYENIPGKILSRSVIKKNGYSGFDILSRTRRGNVQRYQLFVTPFEVLIFKMSGKENYVQGKEAVQYFSSIRLKEIEQKGLDYLPAQGGFGIQLPHYPLASRRQDDIGKRWEFEALDEATGNAYLVIKKSIVNYNFIDEDSFDLQLAEESFRNPDLFEKQISRKLLLHKGFPALQVKEQLKNGAMVNILYLINGPHFYVIAQKQGKQNSIDAAYFESFRLLPYEYPLSRAYTDTFLKFSVQTPVEPKIDEGIRILIESALESAATANSSSGYFSYWPKPRYGVFAGDSTGEMVTVKVQEYPAYFYARDSAKFWKNEINDLSNDHDLMICDPVIKIAGKDFSGIRFSFKDTGSCRKITHMIIIKNNYQYTITVMGDTVSVPGSFTSDFFNSIAPLQQKVTGNIWKNKLHEYFDDLFSKDSLVYNRAFQSITSIYYGPEAIPLLRDAIGRLNIKDKNYFEIKRKLIAELGYIKDSLEGRLEMQLRNIFDQVADTSLFQNEVIKALGRVKTKKSYALLKEIFLQDPPVFENSNDYNSLFESLEDSLALNASFFPELLQLTSLDDYKEPITSLLVSLVDSGLVKPETYAGYFSAIYIDAKINLKKQQGKEEKLMQEVNKREADGDDEPERKYRFNTNGSALDHSSILLMPFYDKNKNVQHFFLKLLQSKEEEVKMNTAILMLRNNKPVDDSILLSLAAEDQYRCLLYTGLEKIRRIDQFPEKFNRQALLARSFLADKNEYDKMDSIVLLSKQPASVKGKKGVVYFFKYRVLKEDQWKIGISGLQPENEKEISTKDELTILTDVSLKENEPMAEQLNRQLKKILFGLHKSGKYFYNDYSGSGNIHALSAYED